MRWSAILHVAFPVFTHKGSPVDEAVERDRQASKHLVEVSEATMLALDPRGELIDGLVKR
ncbi:MAG: hypothetical protein V4696_10275 [Pseudomonadota bacterium]